MRMVFPEIVRASNAEPVLRETQFAAAPAHHRTRELSLLPGPRQRAGLDARSCAGLPTPPPSAVLPIKNGFEQIPGFRWQLLASRTFLRPSQNAIPQGVRLNQIFHEAYLIEAR